MIEFPFVAKPSARYGILHIPIAKIDVAREQGFETVSFLIDSGADLTVVSLALGARIGWKLSERDTSLQLAGMTGESDFVERELEMMIGTQRVRARVAWAQNPDVTDVLAAWMCLITFKSSFDKMNHERFLDSLNANGKNREKVRSILHVNQRRDATTR
ncbi:MAG: aspartyl protease family protein [Chloroflexi bacterium]|nr:aspartyl protease family protein [Chloroflexota bacterium]